MVLAATLLHGLLFHISDSPLRINNNSIHLTRLACLTAPVQLVKFGTWRRLWLVDVSTCLSNIFIKGNGESLFLVHLIKVFLVVGSVPHKIDPKSPWVLHKFVNHPIPTLASAWPFNKGGVLPGFQQFMGQEQMQQWWTTDTTHFLHTATVLPLVVLWKSPWSPKKDKAPLCEAATKETSPGSRCMYVTACLCGHRCSGRRMGIRIRSITCKNSSSHLTRFVKCRKNGYTHIDIESHKCPLHVILEDHAVNLKIKRI